QSNILYFTSPFGPGTATATLVGGPGANINDPNNEPPSPVPEPGTGVLMIIGAVILLLASAVRRIYGR
ncbi:MAG: PEP-CTERM sorting domain-containing protein, partial [Thermoguttaceae bacterium]